MTGNFRRSSNPKTAQTTHPRTLPSQTKQEQTTLPRTLPLWIRSTIRAALSAKKWSGAFRESSASAISLARCRITRIRRGILPYCSGRTSLSRKSRPTISPISTRSRRSCTRASPCTGSGNSEVSEDTTITARSGTAAARSSSIWTEPRRSPRQPASWSPR